MTTENDPIIEFRGHRFVVDEDSDGLGFNLEETPSYGVFADTWTTGWYEEKRRWLVISPWREDQYFDGWIDAMNNFCDTLASPPRIKKEVQP